MACVKCGKDTKLGEDYCENCRDTVRVLSPEERENFSGKTIDEESERGYRHYSDDHQSRVHGEQIHLGCGGLLLILLGGIIVARLFFFALPLLMFIGAIAAVGWLIRELFSR